MEPVKDLDSAREFLSLPPEANREAIFAAAMTEYRRILPKLRKYGVTISLVWPKAHRDDPTGCIIARCTWLNSAFNALLYAMNQERRSLGLENSV
jgi:hypothetical protein